MIRTQSQADENWTLEDHKSLTVNEADVTHLTTVFSKHVFNNHQERAAEFLTALVEVSRVLVQQVTIQPVWDYLSPFGQDGEKSNKESDSSTTTDTTGATTATNDLNSGLDVVKYIQEIVKEAAATTQQKLNFTVWLLRLPECLPVKVNSEEELDLSKVREQDSNGMLSGANQISVHCEGRRRSFQLPTDKSSVRANLGELGLSLGLSLGPSPEQVVAALEFLREQRLSCTYVDKLVPTEGTTGGEAPTVDLVGDISKSVVTLVAGESGSGKTVFAQWGAAPDVPVLYVSVTKLQLEAKPLEENEEFNAWRRLIRLLFPLLYRDRRDTDRGVHSVVQAASRALNSHRNSWAKQIVQTAIDDTYNDPFILSQNDATTTEMTQHKRNLSLWWSRTANSKPLDKLLIVIDEAGRDPRFADGLIAVSRDLLTEFKPYAKRMGLVLCGSGLDSLRQNLDGSKFLGSDPSMAQTVVMTKPNLEVIDKLSGWPSRRAITSGTISRILATNARFLAHGVRKVLMNEIVTDHSKEEETILRQIAFGSFAHAMDYPVRTYHTMNGVKDEANKEVFLLNVFRCMLEQNLTGFPDNHLFDDYRATVSAEMKGKLLRIGVVTQDYTKTSPALKFMACKGKTYPLISASGFSLEEITACHLFRLLQSELTGDEGENLACVKTYTLKASWPPPLPRSPDVEAAIENLENDEKALEDIERIKEILGENETRAIVLRQSQLTAQGFDVGVITKKTDNKIELRAYQSKHWKSKHNVAIKDSLSSLGLCQTNGGVEVASDAERDPSAYIVTNV